MKKVIITVMLLFSFMIVNQAQAAFIYTLDVNIPDGTTISQKSKRIGGLEFKVEGGVYNTDWTIELGDAVPTSTNHRFSHML